MAITYPTTLDSFTNPAGTSVVTSPDHAVQHSDANDAIEAIEAVIGTTSGTAIAKNITVGKFAVSNDGGTINNAIAGTPRITGGTASAFLLGTSTIQGGTANNQVVGTPTVVGGSIGTATIIGGTITSPVVNTATVGTPAITGGTANSLVLGTPTIRAWDGWIEANDTWTMLGTAATVGTISVATGADNRFDKGNKIKFTQGGSTIYSYVSSIPSGTTITIINTSTYPLGTTAVTGNYYSKVENPQSFPKSFTYVPTYTGGTITPTAQRFSISGGICSIFFSLDFVASNAAGLTITGPIASFNNSSFHYGIVAAYDNGSWLADPGAYGVVANSTTINIGKTITTFAANAFAGFTTSGNKSFQGVVQYPI